MKIYARKLSTFIAFVFLFFSLVACEGRYYNKIILTGAFNTNSTVELFTKRPLSDKKRDKIKKDINQILIDLDNLFNIQEREEGMEPDTVLYEIGKNAGKKPVAVNEEVLYVLNRALQMSEISKVKIGEEEIALFDPTIAPAWKAWGFTDNLQAILNDEKIAGIKQEIEGIVSRGLIDYKKITIDEEKSTVYLEKEGMEIDLGAIAKGYAADKVKEYLLKQGYTSGIIDIGRNILLVGDRLGNDFRVGIQTPYIGWFNGARFDKEGNWINQIYGTLVLSDLSLVTSGTYEKYIKDENGNEYHHILNPKTGMPINNGVISITVVTAESILADGYSTTLFALGLEKGMGVVEATEGLDAVWVVKNGDVKEVYISSGLEDKFIFNEHVIQDGYVYKGVYHENTED